MLILFLWISAGVLWRTGETIRCYSCRHCNDPSAKVMNVDCTRIQETTSCYMLTLHSSGEVVKSCGGPELDQNIQEGCHHLLTGIVCRCSTDLCNVNGSPGDTSSPGSQLSTPASAGNGWSCYWCSDCGKSLGNIVDCSGSSTNSCYTIQEMDGTTHRTCALASVEKLGLGNHCYQFANQVILCRCSTKNCNTHPPLLAQTSTTLTTPAERNPTTTAPADEEFFCHFCINCGDSVGRLVKCPDAKSCALIIQNGNVSRTCGTPSIEVRVPEARGCRSSGGNEVCKCSTTECNSFYRKTGISPLLEDEYSENVILVASALHQQRNTATVHPDQSSSAGQTLMWPFFITLNCLLQHMSLNCL